ncbi:MAG: tetratricopeptide repeat protein [Betaproteobacteria bacterium]|nr:tetratricopeptide repeat protein [Betaproteobacteria bacterium]
MGKLVTILTRTLGRPCLADAAACVAAQTYRPIEWLVVDASGRGVDVPPAGDVPVRVVSSGEPMLRSRAGNFGFDHAQGSRIAVLDDDDLLLPRYVEQISRGLDERPDVLVGYCDVRVETDRPDVTGLYAFEYSELMLLRRNLFPPNGGLFDVSLVRDRGVRYDVALDWFDDWDLWLQMSAHTPFLHVRETLAVYRLGLSTSGVWHHDAPDADPVLRTHEGIVRGRYASRRAALESSYEALKTRAREVTGAGRLPEAAALWSQAHAVLPHDPEPVVAYAEIALAAGDAEAARAAIENGLALMPDEAYLHRALAALLHRGGDEDGARRALAVAERCALGAKRNEAG